MPNIGPAELIIILVIAIVFIGPGKLPDVGAALGKSIREFRKASTDISEATRVDAAPVPPAAPSATAAPAPTPEPSVPTPTAPTVPAPIAAPATPAAGDESAQPPA